MIYITGDTHGEQNRILQIQNEYHLTNGDTLIICGDFGFLFHDDKQENAFLDDLENLPFTICFCDGNHENFPAIYSYPVEEWNGGKVHKIRKNIFHLMRGQIFEIENKSFFVMGGAYSIDKYMRLENVSWWKEELPSNEEYKEASDNLKKHNFKVNYVITHTAPTEIVRNLCSYPDYHDAELCGFLEWVMHETTFDKWFFGHWHIDKTIYEKFHALYYDVTTFQQESK